MSQNFERLCKDYKNIENYEKAKADDFKNWVCLWQTFLEK